MKIKKTTELLMILLSVVLIFSCSKNKEIMNNGVLYASIRGENREGYDPTRGWGSYGNPLFHSTLLRRDDDLNIVFDLATSLKVSKDRLRWEVTIRKDARFSNGLSLDAEDVAYTFREAKECGGKVDLTMLKEFKIKGRYKVLFILKKPWVTFNQRLITLGIVPKKVHQKNKVLYSRNPIGSGPYKLVNWTEGQQLMVEVNPHYYGEIPDIKKIVFLFMNEDASFAAAKAGKLHIAALPHQFSNQKINGMKIHDVRSVDNRGIVFPMIPDRGEKTEEGYCIGNNVTSDIAVRKALNLAVDRDLLVKTILEGYGEPAYGVADGLPWDNPDIRIKDKNIIEARKILKKSGWRDTDGDGIIEKNGIFARFTLIYFSYDTVRQHLALAFKDMAAKIGIDVKVLGKSTEDVKRMQHYCAVLFGFGSHNPEEIYNLYHSKNIGKGHFNPGFYKNLKVDTYLDRAMSSFSIKKSVKWWKKAQWDGTTGLSLKGDAPWVWLVNISHIYFVSEKIDIGKSRIEPHGHGWPLTANITNWKWKR